MSLCQCVQSFGSGELAGDEIDEMARIFWILMFVELTAVVAIHKKLDGTFRDKQTAEETP